MMTRDYCFTDALRNIDSERIFVNNGKCVMPIFDEDDWEDDDDDDDDWDTGE